MNSKGVRSRILVSSICVCLNMGAAIRSGQAAQQESAAGQAEPPKLKEVRELGTSRDLHNTHRLLMLLKDSDDRVRVAAAQALGFLLYGYAVGPGLSMGGEDYHPLEYLGYKITSPFLVSGYRSALLHALADPSAHVRAAALRALGGIFQRTGGKEAKDAPDDIKRAILPFLKDPNDDLASAAADAVHEIGIAEAIPSLMGLLQRPNREVRLKALLTLNWTSVTRPNTLVEFVSLQKDTGPFIRLLRDPDAEIRQQASFSLAFMCWAQLCDASTVPPLLDALHDENTRLGAVRSLLHTKDPRAVEPVLAALKEDSAREAKTLADLLPNWLDTFVEFVNRDRAVEIILGYLRDGSPNARAIAANTLPRLKDDRITAALIEALDDPVPGVRLAAVNALGRSSDPRAIPALISRLHDENDQVAEAATRFVGFSGDLRALKSLIELLHDRNLQIQTIVIEDLPKFKDPSAIDALASVVEDRRSELRGYAVGLLCATGDPRGLPAVRQYFSELTNDRAGPTSQGLRTCLQRLEAASPK